MQNESFNKSQIQSNTAEEQYIGLIPNTYKWAWYGLKQWFDVIVTNKRLVFMHVTELYSQPEKYFDIKVEEILARDKRNFAVEINELKNFSFALGEEEIGTCGRPHSINGEMKFETARSKYFFYIPISQTMLARDSFKKVGLKIIRMEKPLLA